MKTENMLLLVYSFTSASRAEAVRYVIETLDRQIGERTGHFAVVMKREDGSISLREPRDFGEELADLTTSLVGGLAWFAYTFVGLMGTQPAAFVERVTSEATRRMVRETGFPEQSLYEIGAELDTGSAAIVGLIPAEERDVLVAELERLGGKLWEHPIPPTIAAELHSAT
ncbi:hypothetical protein EYB53_009650 [Candidatus Chloroploca sp. M-50]|uniref:Uncharacterized protein n=1 Tax=Candidatus Chloroploca mongolica TaxID=2528176 RepID=A0ABS4D962_9CHLR|nr:hypothetical protein [Candidatus Chloroploca mongolica]MBP1465967.1 hypothetical protein [Candidatus Chloroploca mongolica]